MPHLLRLFGESRDELRMGVPERVHRDTGGEIEIAIAVGRDEPNALAPLKSKVDTRIGR